MRNPNKFNQRFNHCALLLFILCLSLTKGNTQDLLGFLQGRIIDKTNREPLAFGHILLDKGGLNTLSDEKGVFFIENIPHNTYLLTISYIGYKTQTIKIVIGASSAEELIIEMESAYFGIDEVFVTASRNQQHISLAAASTELVTAKQLKEKNIQTFEQALDGLNGITVTRSSTSNVQTVSIRGASEVAGGGVGNRVLLLIDGRPAISPESGGVLWNLVPLSSIARIEVVKGAYSSLYGSSAMGGVIQVITKEPEAKSQTGLHFEYGVHNPLPKDSGYDKYRDFYTLALTRSGRSGRMSYLFDTSLRSTDGNREKTAFKLFNTYTKIKYQLSGLRTIQFSANFNKINNDTPATWINAFRPYEVAAHRSDDYQKRKETNIDLYYEAITDKEIKYSSRFYYYQNNSELTFNDDPDNDTTNVNIGTSQIVAKEFILAKRIGNVSQVNIFSDNGHEIIIGSDVLYDITDGTPDTLLYGEHSAYNLAFYLQDEWRIKEKMIVTTGFRFDYYEIIKAYHQVHLSPKISAVYKWNANVSSRLLLAQAFRNPSIAERFIKFEQGGGLRFVPNPGLTTERLDLSAELGTKWSFNKRWSSDVALFYNNYSNLISFQRLSAANEPLLYQVINLKKAIMQGAELKLNYHHGKGLSMGAGYTYLDARDNSPNRINDQLAYKVKHSFYVDINKYWEHFSLHFNARYRSAIEEVFIYPGSEPDAFWLLDLRAAYHIKEGYSLYLAVKNMTNSQYEELERYRMPGRSFSIGARADL